jgi:hypothetical protein
MKTRKFFAVLSLGFVAACAQMGPHEAVPNTNIRKAAQNARTRGDHDALTKYFEGVAREMQAKAKEQKHVLEHYEKKGYLYGRQAQDLKSHTAALLRKYEANAEENIKEAAIHREMGLEQAKRERDLAARDGQIADAAKQRSNPNRDFSGL